VILIVGERQAQSQQRGGFQALAAIHHHAEAANHQSGAHQQHHGQRDLRRHQNIAQPMAGAAHRAAAAAFLQGVGEVRARALPGGRQAGQNTARDRRQQGECQHAAIQLDVFPAQDVALDFGGHPAFDQAHSPSRDQQAEGGAGYRAICFR
jgi:hypothetical protein